MGDDDDVCLGARTQPLADPACACADRILCRGVETALGGPLGLEEGEVEPGVLGVGFEDFTGLLKRRIGRGGRCA